MLNIVLFGPPGAGKGTQASKLIDKYGLVHLSTGNVFRANIKEKSELGKLAKNYIDKGNLVPDEVTIKMLKSEVNKHLQTKGFIFDGFPRTNPQAEALEQFLVRKNTNVSLMLTLNVPEDELIKRLLLRKADSGRVDDQNEKVVRNRIKVYNEQISIVADFYAKQNKFVTVNGVGSIEDVFHQICNFIDKY